MVVYILAGRVMKFSPARVSLPTCQVKIFRPEVYGEFASALGAIASALRPTKPEFQNICQIACQIECMNMCKNVR